jgi:predicted Rossmann fold flavoprotein
MTNLRRGDPLMSQVIIVGGGASGLTAAIFAAREKHKVIVLEQKDKIGKKILATGNGKCNYTNLEQNAACYRGNDNTFAMKVLSQFDTTQTIDFFKELGIYPKNKKGYIYPNSEQASSVVEVLKIELEHLKVPVYCDTRVEKINYQNNKFTVLTNKEKFNADKVIIAAGGCASKSLGSDGSGYKFAKDLGHKIIKPLPALVQLKSNEKYFKTLAGVRCEVKLKLYIEGKVETEEKGELLIAAYGVSGIPILQISRFAAKALDEKKKVNLCIDFLPTLSEKETTELLTERINRNSNKTMEELFLGLLNNKLSYICLKEAGIDLSLPCCKIDKNRIPKLTKQIKEWMVPITDTNPFDQAQVTAGGVDTREINPDTLESNITKGLYFTGEILDVDGTCGGYNLQWAWSTGAVAGKNL